MDFVEKEIEVMTQMSFDSLKPKYKITKPIRLIELFAGIGAQAKALLLKCCREYLKN